MFLQENQWRDAIRGGKNTHALQEDLSKCKALLMRLQAGDRLEYGQYAVCNRLNFRKPFAKSPIVWRVLAREGNRLLLVSENCLDMMDFDRSSPPFGPIASVSWAQSTVRQTLNTTCMEAWFTKAEQRLIQKTLLLPDSNPVSHISDSETTEDRLFLLSLGEVEKYIYKAELRERPEEQGNDCPACGADYNSAVALFLLTKRRTSDMMIYAEPSTWWLRTPGREKECRMVVGYDGRPSTDGRVIDSIEVKIRPAMWLDLGRLAIFSADGGIKTE